MDSSDIEKWRVKLDSYANVEDGVEYWLARDLMAVSFTHLLAHEKLGDIV